MRIQGVNGHLDIEALLKGQLSVSATENTPTERGAITVIVRPNENHAHALAQVLQGGAMELSARAVDLEGGAS